MTSKFVLVYGGCGALGAETVKALKAAGFKVASVDFMRSADADISIVLSGKSLEEDVKHVCDELQKSGIKLDVLICVAGGYVHGSVKESTIFAHLDKMYKFNIQSAVAAAHIACHFLKENGLLVLTGASGALKPTPANIAYGISKVGTHQLIASLAHPDGGLPKGARVIGMAPIMLDTKANRDAMPTADRSTWTPLSEVAKKLVEWSSGQNLPPNGSLTEIRTAGGKTEWVQVKYLYP
jgi:dihydropteridine reductase